MQNLTQIVTLLQLVLALLSNPQMAQNPQVQTLAAQAVQSATEALSSNVATDTTPTIPLYNPQAAAGDYTGGTATPTYVAPVSPSCSLSVDYLNSPRSVSWNVENGTSFVPSLQWRYTQEDGTWSSWTPMLLPPTYVPPHDPSVSALPETTQTSTVNGLHLLNDQGSSYFANMVNQTSSYPIDVQLSISGTTCDYTIK